MEIAAHDISFRTAHSLREERSVTETFVFATRGARERIQRTTDDQGNVEQNRQIQSTNNGDDRVQVSDEAKKASEAENRRLNFELTVQQKMELELVRMAFDRIAEGEFEFVDPEEFLDQLEKAGEGNFDEKGKNKSNSSGPSQGEGSGEEGANFGFSYRFEQRVEESEKLSFQAGGSIRTEDGEEIDFQLDLNLSRSFTRETSIQIQGGNAKLVDPLVINFEGKAAELEQTNFSFDLNSDGETEEISRLGPGSGFLAFDENENGEIDDGGELFGPETGRGFRELSELDEDGNEFIDSGDSVFDDLQLLTFNHSGDRALISLEKAGIGAIFLESADTEFSFKTQTENQLMGQLKRTGIFIGTDGNVGSVQEMDFATESPEQESEPADENSTDENESSESPGESEDFAGSRFPGRGVPFTGRRPGSQALFGAGSNPTFDFSA